jgi:hypothetical protein
MARVVWRSRSAIGIARSAWLSSGPSEQWSKLRSFDIRVNCALSHAGSPWTTSNRARCSLVAGNPERISPTERLDGTDINGSIPKEDGSRAVAKHQLFTRSSVYSAQICVYSRRSPVRITAISTTQLSPCSLVSRLSFGRLSSGAFRELNGGSRGSIRLSGSGIGKLRHVFDAVKPLSVRCSPLRRDVLGSDSIVAGPERAASRPWCDGIDGVQRHRHHRSFFNTLGRLCDEGAPQRLKWDNGRADYEIGRSRLPA